MTITINTPIADLAKIDNISTRTLNVCRVSGIITLGNIFEHTEEEISTLRNCGRKTLEELRHLVVKYGYLVDGKSKCKPLYEIPFLANEELAVSVMATALEAVWCASDVPRLLRVMVGKPEKMAWRVVKGDYDYAMRLGDFSLERWVELFHSWLKMMDRWAAHDSLRPAERTAIRNHAAKLRAFWDESVMLRAYLDLSPSLRTLWQGAYERRFAEMPSRTRNVFRAFSDFDKLLPCFNGLVVLKVYLIKNCGRKSFEEFQDFMEHVKDAFLEFVALMSHDKDSRYEHMLRMEQLSHDYPFLDSDDVSALATQQVKGHDEIPLFYLLERYIVRGKTRAAAVYRELYGLGGGEPKPLVKISQRLNVTRERVRQLAATTLTLPNSLDDIHGEVSSLLRDRKMVPDYDPIWSTIKTGPSKFSVYQLMGLCVAVDNSYSIENPTGGKHVYLVKRNLLESVRVMYTISELSRKVELRTREPFELPILDYIYGDRPRETFNKDVRELIPIFADYFKDNPRVEFNGKDKLLVKANTIDVPATLRNILANHGTMMSAIELQEAFNNAFPDHAIKSMGSFRAQIYRSRIIPVGRSGYYVHPSWQGTYTGKLVDYLEVILEASERPLSLQELTERARQSFPRTTSRSIATLVGLDTQQRFVQFEGYYFGLKSRAYYGETYKTRHIVKRFPFDKRLVQLKEFVAAHGHLPMVHPDEEEGSLNRWLKNVEGGYVNITPQQRADFKAYMRTIVTVPHTKPELAFSEACDELRRAIEAGEDLTAQPAAAHWEWACRMMPLRGTWGDNRNLYFEQLLKFVRSRGMNLDQPKRKRGRAKLKD